MFEDLTVWTRALTNATATLVHTTCTRRHHHPGHVHSRRLRPGHHGSRRLGRAAHPDDGYSTEAIVVTALLVAAAFTVIGILVAKLTARANSIQL